MQQQTEERGGGQKIWGRLLTFLVCVHSRVSHLQSLSRTRGLAFTRRARGYQGRNVRREMYCPGWAHRGRRGWRVGGCQCNKTLVQFLILPLTKHVWDSGGVRTQKYCRMDPERCIYWSSMESESGGEKRMDHIPFSTLFLRSPLWGQSPEKQERQEELPFNLKLWSPPSCTRIWYLTCSLGKV